jgi:hypothetical protein
MVVFHGNARRDSSFNRRKIVDGSSVVLRQVFRKLGGAKLHLGDSGMRATIFQPSSIFGDSWCYFHHFLLGTRASGMKTFGFPRRESNSHPFLSCATTVGEKMNAKSAKSPTKISKCFGKLIL